MKDVNFFFHIFYIIEKDFSENFVAEIFAGRGAGKIKGRLKIITEKLIIAKGCRQKFLIGV